MHRFGVAAGRVRSSAFRFGDCPRRVGLRAHCFRFSARTVSEWPSAGWFFRLPLRKLPSAGWSSGSRLPIFGMRRFGDCPRRAVLRAHGFRFSACTASEIALGGLAFGLTASAFRHAPLRSCRSAGCPSGSLLPLFGTHRFGDCPRRVGLRAHRFRFSACTASEIALGGLVLPPSASEIPLDGLVFGFTASAFRHAPIRSCPRRVGLRAHCFRFSARADSEWPLGGWPSGLLLRRLPFGGLAFGFTASAFRHAPLRSCPRRVGLRAHCFRFSARAASEIALGGLAFGLTASAFRHAPLRSGRWASSFFRLPLRKLPLAGWPSGSLLPLFGMHRFAPPRRRSEGRRSAPTRHLFHFKTLIPTC